MPPKARRMLNFHITLGPLTVWVSGLAKVRLITRASDTKLERFSFVLPKRKSLRKLLCSQAQGWC
jgi:hypothetical protein